MDIGERIKNDVMMIYGSTKKCSESCGISRSTLIKIYETGLLGASHKTLYSLAIALGYDFIELKKGNIVADRELMEKITMPPVTTNSAFEEDVLTQLRQLSIKGQVKVLDYINDLKVVYPSEVNNG